MQFLKLDANIQLRLLATLLICTNAMTSRMLDRARSFDCVAKFLDIDLSFGYKG